MATMQERCAHFLAQGLKPTQVASILGCTPGRISQIIKEPDFPEILARAQEQYEGPSDSEAAAHQLVSNKYLALESKLVDQIEAQAAMMAPKELISALSVVAARQDKAAARTAQLRLPQQGSTINVAVQLSMPQHTVPEYVVNSQGEIVSINQKSMAPMGSGAVRSLFTGMKNSRIAAASSEATSSLHSGNLAATALPSDF